VGQKERQSLVSGLRLLHWSAFLIRCHLIFAIFLFLFITAQLLSKYLKNRSMSNVAPIILAQKYNPQMNPVLLGNARRTRHAYSKAGRIRRSSTTNYDICLVCPASSVSGVKIAAPIALAQH
jgi:hypothetical protein